MSAVLDSLEEDPAEDRSRTGNQYGNNNLHPLGNGEDLWRVLVRDEPCTESIGDVVLVTKSAISICRRSRCKNLEGGDAKEEARLIDPRWDLHLKVLHTSRGRLWQIDEDSGSVDVRVAVSVAGLHLHGAVRCNEPIVGVFVDEGRAEAGHCDLAENDLHARHIID